VVIAPDKFKGSQAAHATSVGLKRFDPTSTMVRCPVADVTER
jgi:glycerate 2-kinase